MTMQILTSKFQHHSVGFNFDGTLALTGAYDGKVQIWNVSSGALLQCLEGPEGMSLLVLRDSIYLNLCHVLDIEWAAWHPRGNAVLAGSGDGTVWMWMSHNGQCVQVSYHNPYKE